MARANVYLLEAEDPERAARPIEHEKEAPEDRTLNAEGGLERSIQRRVGIQRKEELPRGPGRGPRRSPRGD